MIARGQISNWIERGSSIYFGKISIRKHDCSIFIQYPLSSHLHAFIHTEHLLNIVAILSVNWISFQNCVIRSWFTIRDSWLYNVFFFGNRQKNKPEIMLNAVCLPCFFDKLTLLAINFCWQMKSFIIWNSSCSDRLIFTPILF